MRREKEMPKEFLELPLEKIPFVVFDTETSLKSQQGQHAFYDVVEIGCVAFTTKDGETDYFHSLVKPYYPFNRASCRAMHITEIALESAPAFPEIANFIGNILARRVIVGQNTQFDIRALRHAIDLYGNLGHIEPDLHTQLLFGLEQKNLDTKVFFSRLFPSEKQKSLDAIALKIGVDPERTKHSAIEDARLTVSVFRKLVDLSRSKNVTTLGHLFDLQERNLGKARQTSFF